MYIYVYVYMYVHICLCVYVYITIKKMITEVSLAKKSTILFIVETIVLFCSDTRGVLSCQFLLTNLDFFI